MSTSDVARRALASQAVGCAVIREVAPLLTRAGIAVMPLKGIWLQVCVLKPTALRVITDVDLLVPELAYPRAIELLAAVGWRAHPGHASETSFDHPRFGLPVDLHRRLFTRGAFRLPTASMFERARRDSLAFGVELHLPDPLDAFAHLIGHFVKSRTSPRDRSRLADFEAIAALPGFDPAACARRLEQAGMARAARYVLGQLVDEQAFARALLVSLPADPIGAAAVDAASRIAGHEAVASWLGALPGFLLDRSLPAGAIALWFRALERMSTRAARPPP